ncbi:MAG: hypothetical protein DRI24_13325 [Deltaproteobacteria bacterium]|nr:MAG: hypothetical protein DRI24_13325 [Deltaproteobacteria bacterium]
MLSDSIFTKEMSSFLSGYMTCALWTSHDADGECLDVNYGTHDISGDTQMEMTKDCVEFYKANRELFPEGYSMNEAGHDFWLTRNGHGAGFWDRDLGEAGDILTEKCEAYPEVDLYVGDNGLICS